MIKGGNMMSELMVVKNRMDRKIISISGKRQITIPLKFFEQLNFGTEVECFIDKNSLVIRPIRENLGGEFAEQILADLIKQGYSGEKLLEKFRVINAKVRPAVQTLIDSAEKVAEGKGNYASYEDVFGTEEK
jgi:hypothetical protein